MDDPTMVQGDSNRYPASSVSTGPESDTGSGSGIEPDHYPVNIDFFKVRAHELEREHAAIEALLMLYEENQLLRKVLYGGAPRPTGE